MSKVIEMIAVQTVYGARTSRDRRGWLRGVLGPFEVSEMALAGMDIVEWRAELLKLCRELGPEFNWAEDPFHSERLNGKPCYCFAYEVRQ